MPCLNIFVKAIIFDMDGVITRTMPDHFRAWKSVLNKAGIRVSRLEIYEREGQQGFQSVKEILSKRGILASDTDLKKILATKEKIFNQTARLRFISGSRSFLKSIRRQNIKVGLVTGTSRKEVQKLLPPWLYQSFEAIVTGSDVKRGKPYPEPYRKCLQQLRLTPKDVVVIENAPFGISSAQSAGLRCLALKTSLPEPYLKNADFVFSSYRDMLSQVAFKRRE